MRKQNPMNISADQLTHLQNINSQIEALQEERDGILALIRLSIPAGSNTQIGDYTIKVGEPVERLNLALIAKKYTVIEHPELYKMSPDTARVREHFSPQQLRAEGLVSESAGRVTIQ